MLRQLLSTSGAPPPGNACSNFEKSLTYQYPIASTSFDNPVIAAVTSSPLSQSATVQTNPLRNSANEGGKSLAVLENMSFSGYSTQTPTVSDHLEILDSNNDLNGTTELFSSTFAMLSADSSVSWDGGGGGGGGCSGGTWNEQARRFINETDECVSNGIQMNPNGPSFGYPVVHSTIPGCSRYLSFDNCVVPNSSCYITSNCQELRNGSTAGIEMAQPGILMNGNGVSVYRNYGQRKNCTEKLCHPMTQSRFSDAYRRLAHIPVPAGFGEMNGGEGGGGGEGEQVMCMACRGVYSSRRSLTGHIGRNEKCREIIGRNYLDQMGGIVESMQLADPGNLTPSNSVIDPVCPHCDRFISHYKGNIRRHVNQCMKSMRNGSKPRRKDAILKQIGSGTAPYGGGGDGVGGGCLETFSDSYQPHVLATTAMNRGNCGTEENAWIDGCGLPANDYEPAKSKTNNAKKDRSNDDPFRCPLCDFATIYKGNMKRHLSTCHGLQDDDLKDGCIDRLKSTENVDSRTERGRRSKNAQHCKSASKQAQPDVENGPNDDSNISKSSAGTLADISSTGSAVTVPTSATACKQENSSSLAVIPSNGIPSGITPAAGSNIVEMVKTSDGGIQPSRSNTIDEAIEAVIANGIEDEVCTKGRDAA